MKEFMLEFAGHMIALLAVMVATGMAVYQLWVHRKTAARRATLDFITNFEVHNTQWAVLRTKFRTLKAANRLLSLVNSNRSVDNQDRIDVVTYLNHYELVAVAIKNNIIDEELYKEWFRTPYVRAWMDARSLVYKMREERENPELFIQFEQLANKWNNDVDFELKEEKAARKEAEIRAQTAETRLQEETAARQAAEQRVAELEATLKSLRQPREPPD